MLRADLGRFWAVSGVMLARWIGSGVRSERMEPIEDELPFEADTAPEAPSDLGAPRFEDIHVAPAAPEVEVAPAPEVEVVEVEAVAVDPTARPADFVDTDKVGTVFPGDKDGHANMAVRLLGFGDSGDYSGVAVDRVKYLQLQAGLDDDGIIRGSTWALILRPIKVGASGYEVLILSRLLGLPEQTVFDSQMADAVADLQARAALLQDGKMSAETWYAALTA